MLYLSCLVAMGSAGLLGYLIDIEVLVSRLYRASLGVWRGLFVKNDTSSLKPTSSDIAQMLDLLILALSAGLSFDYALDLYCKSHDNLLAHDLHNALFSWQIGATTRLEGLKALSFKYENPSFERFVQCVTESMELGAPIAHTLENHADMIRQTRQFEQEQLIEKLPIQILIPLTTLILPAMLIAILGPIFAGLTH